MDATKKLFNSLAECVSLMKAIVEPCDHEVGICWCDWHRTLNTANDLLTQTAAHLDDRDRAAAGEEPDR